MAMLTYNDGVTLITITSQHQFNVHSTAFVAYLTAMYALHEEMPLGLIAVDTVSPNNYVITLNTANGRQIVQKIQKTGQWRFRQESQSDFFVLAELLVNNFLRSATQDLIDAFNVDAIDVVFV